MRLRLFAALVCIVAVGACTATPTEQAAPPELRTEIQGDSTDFGGFVPLDGGDPIEPVCPDSLVRPDGTCRGGGVGSGT